MDALMAFGMKGAFTITVRAAADLSSSLMLGRALGLDGDFANTGREALGIILQNVDSGQMVTLGYMGRLPFYPVGTMSAGYLLGVESGRFIASVGGGYAVGRALGQYGGGTAPGPNTNVGSGSLGEGLFNFVNAEFQNTLASSAGLGAFGGY